LLSPVAFQKLQFWLDEQGMEADVICAAINTTREQAERPGIAYLEGVLRNWYNEGGRAMADLRVRKRSPTDKKTDKRADKKAAKLAALFRQKADEMEAERGVEGA